MIVVANTEKQWARRLEKLQRSGVQLSERLAPSLGIMTGNLWVPLKHLEHYDTCIWAYQLSGGPFTGRP